MKKLNYNEFPFDSDSLMERNTFQCSPRHKNKTDNFLPTVLEEKIFDTK